MCERTLPSILVIFGVQKLYKPFLILDFCAYEGLGNYARRRITDVNRNLNNNFLISRAKDDKLTSS